MHDPLLTALDMFADEQGEGIGRPEAVRRALTDHLRAKGYLPAQSEAAGDTDSTG